MIHNIFSDKVKLILYSLTMAVVLLLSLLLGLSSGKSAAQAQTIALEAKNLQAGFDFFYSDQNRFPTAVEFSQNTAMSAYFNNFPPIEFVSSNCSQSFIYQRLSDSQYKLDFCLPAASSGYRGGWNVVSEQK